MDDERHSAKPEQEDSFEKGQEQKPDSSEEEHEPDFARGERTGGEPGEEGRFSEGQEELPDSPEKHKEGRFSTGHDEETTSE